MGLLGLLSIKPEELKMKPLLACVKQVILVFGNESTAVIYRRSKYPLSV